MFVRHAWEAIEPIEALIGDSIGQGKAVRAPSNGRLLERLADAYERAQEQVGNWDGRTYYVAFGDGEHRNWDDAREFGFVAAGGDPWYSKSLRRLGPGDRVFVYIPKGSGVGGYVGVGEVR